MERDGAFGVGAAMYPVGPARRAGSVQQSGQEHPAGTVAWYCDIDPPDPPVIIWVRE
jgi:hypothetical protein